MLGGMASDGRSADAPPAKQLVLRSGRQVEVSETVDGDALVVRAPGGEVLVTIRLTEDGPVVSLSAPKIEIASASELALRCDRLRVEAADASFDVRGDLVERVGGSVDRRAQGTSTQTAHSMALEAQTGGIRVAANDDVDVQGERVRLNCEEPPMPQTIEEFEARRARSLDAPLGPGLAPRPDAPPKRG
jgi:hypothetical protein